MTTAEDVAEVGKAVARGSRRSESICFECKLWSSIVAVPLTEGRIMIPGSMMLSRAHKSRNAAKQ